MDRLKEILDYKRREVERRKNAVTLAQLRERITKRYDQRSLEKALRRKDEITLIAEIKRASPSAGVIRENFNPTELARAYERGGANALSVLTDEKFFQGQLKYLLQARSASNLPCLRKDFIVDEYQIWEARLAEADAVLLIVAALSKEELRQFHDVAQDAELDVLMEVHNEKELEVAIDLNAHVIGINNRNLQTFKVDLAVTEELAPKIPKEHTIVSESGIHTVADVERVRACGVNAILVGESLMRQENVELATRKLMTASA
jgi:indole-3-glycerol phosphate synthase